MNISRLLVLAPHTDDAELGCGGTIARLLEENTEVFVTAFSIARQSVPGNGKGTTLHDEFIESMNSLNVPAGNRIIFDYEVRKLSYCRQEVLDNLIRLRKEIQPDTVFLPSGNDLHQDHQVLYAEGLRAFKEVTVWGYELPWNNVTFSANAFVLLEQRHLDTKWYAMQAYKSQLELKRPYFSRDFIEGLARVRGVQVKGNYAEAFEVTRIKI